MRLTAVNLVKSHAKGQREFDCRRKWRKDSRSFMHAHVEEPAAEDASDRNVSEFTVGGMNCQNCARQVTEAIQNVTGVAFH